MYLVLFDDVIFKVGSKYMEVNQVNISTCEDLLVEIYTGSDSILY